MPQETASLPDISHMTSKFVEIVPPIHRQGNSISVAAIRCPVFLNGLCSEGHSFIFLAIQTHLSRRSYPGVDFLGLRRNGSSSQVINQVQYFLEQASWHRHLGQLERDVATMADDHGTDLDQLLP